MIYGVCLNHLQVVAVQPNGDIPLSYSSRAERISQDFTPLKPFEDESCNVSYSVGWLSTPSNYRIQLVKPYDMDQEKILGVFREMGIVGKRLLIDNKIVTMGMGSYCRLQDRIGPSKAEIGDIFWAVEISFFPFHN